MREEIQFPTLAKARPPMPIDCSDRVALLIEDGTTFGTEHERLEHGRALYRKIREQIARELIIVETKKKMTEIDSPTPDGLSGPAKRRRLRVQNGVSICEPS